MHIAIRSWPDGRKQGGRGGEGRTIVIKSNNPHLAGGQKISNLILLYIYIIKLDIYIYILIIDSIFIYNLYLIIMIMNM